MIAFFGSLLMMFIQNINAYILAFTDLINKGLDYINMGLNIFQKAITYVWIIFGYILGLTQEDEEALF
jgi:hypothetical protein